MTRLNTVLSQAGWFQIPSSHCTWLNLVIFITTIPACVWFKSMSDWFTVLLHGQKSVDEYGVAAYMLVTSSWFIFTSYVSLVNVHPVWLSDRARFCLISPHAYTAINIVILIVTIIVWKLHRVFDVCIGGSDPGVSRWKSEISLWSLVTVETCCSHFEASANRYFLWSLLLGIRWMSLYCTLCQSFQNCESWPKSGSQSSDKWVTNSFKKHLFCRSNNINFCYKWAITSWNAINCRLSFLLMP